MTEAGKLFTRIYAGSKWNAEILRSRGFERVIPWAQGIDLEMFSPHGTILPRSDKFRIYSGGKLEFRKGQDITLEAFKKFHQKYPDSELIVAWDSPWPILAMSMARSKYVKAPALDLNQKYNLEKWMLSEGMPENSFQNIGSLPNYKMPELMRSCDVGLFPNRAEGGTNLVAMESIACGLPCILSNNTGHKDLLEEVDCYSLEEQKKISPLNEKDGTEGWGESSIEEIFSQLEFAYNNRDLNKQKGLNAAKKIQRWSWFNKVGELVNDL
jgi:glycosyltransferase involved in cell wall biosynthesis